MKPLNEISRAGVELIKRFEGFRARSARLANDRWTIGYGHTKTARQGAIISEADAEILLLYDLVEIGKAVNDWVFAPLTQNEFDALVSFAFNIGLDEFRRSVVLRQVNEGAMLQAASAFDPWRKADFEGADIVVDALVRRRAAEKAWFLTPVKGWTPAPSPVLRPKFDDSASAAVLLETPVDLRTALVGDAAVLVRDTKPPVAVAFERTPVEEASAEEAPVEVEPAATSNPEPLQWAGPSEPEPHRALDPEPSNTEMFPVYRPDTAPDIETTLIEPSPARSEKLGFAPLISLGVVGLVVFAAAIIWGLNAKPEAGLFNPLMLGGVVGIVAIGCIAVVVYALLSKLGDRSE